MSKFLQWGIMGTGNIARQFCQDMDGTSPKVTPQHTLGNLRVMDALLRKMREV